MPSILAARPMLSLARESARDETALEFSSNVFIADASVEHLLDKLFELLAHVVLLSRDPAP